MPTFKWLFLNNLRSKTLGQIQNLDPHRLMSRLKSKTTPGDTLRTRPYSYRRLDPKDGCRWSKSSFNGLEGKDSSENRNLIRSRSDATSACSQSSLGRGRRTTKSVRLQHESVVSALNKLRPSSNSDDHRFAQVLTAQQAISVFRQAKTGGQFGHVTREVSDLDFT